MHLVSNIYILNLTYPIISSHKCLGMRPRSPYSPITSPLIPPSPDARPPISLSLLLYSIKSEQNQVKHRN